MMKRQSKNSNNTRTNLLRINPNWYLLFGIISMGCSHLTFSIDILGWISMVPFLIYLRLTKGLRPRLLFVITFVVAWSLIIVKIISPPIPYAFIFLYSIPICLIHLPGYLVWARYRHSKFDILLFPAIMTIMEWVQYTFTPLASWGVAAYTQVHSLAPMQFLSIFGLAGLSFLVYWINSSITDIIIKGKVRPLSFQIPLATLAIVFLFGTFRIEYSKSIDTETIKVATVGTDSKIGGLALPTKKDNEQDILKIFNRTKIAACAGARIVVWNEAAFLLLPENEAIWIDSISNLASKEKVNIVASYVVLLSKSPLRYENKYILADSNGYIVNEYNKHEPVPGEPAKKGEEVLKVTQIEGANIGGAICYDYDFPYLARGYGQLNADIVAVPSSDWRGIDPLHTSMAAFRAVEQGHSVLRSTRFGLSAGITPYGEMLSKMSSFDTNDKIMLSQLPKQGVTTVYSIIGDVFLYTCIVFALFIIIKERYR